MKEVESRKFNVERSARVGLGKHMETYHETISDCQVIISISFEWSRKVLKSWGLRVDERSSRGGGRGWFAPEDMKNGDEIGPRIDEAIRVHDKLLIVLSENSVGSPWVKKEVETAFEKERKQKRTVLFTIRLDDAVMETDEAWAADIRRMRHIGDFGSGKVRTSIERRLGG